ncbi:MAG: cysteine hydrolase [Ruminococcus sp.]|nr:cysteine hydrolase [Ruminococcus sp.]MBR6669490.1 cysteine hydrolase [Ruminococcus sp.]
MSDKKALIVIDLQNDYLWNNRKAMFSYNTEKLINSVNTTIADYKNNGYDIIYILQVFPNIITNKWFIGFSIKGTQGAELYEKLNVVSDLCFEKNLPDAYSSKQFKEYMKKQNYSEVVLCGLDECGCVQATAKGALKNNTKVSIIQNCTVSRFSDEKIKKTREALLKSGVKYI